MKINYAIDAFDSPPDKLIDGQIYYHTIRKSIVVLLNGWWTPIYENGYYGHDVNAAQYDLFNDFNLCQLG